MNLHQTRDHEMLKEANEPATDLVDQLDKYFGANEEILNQLFGQEHFSRTWRAGKTYPHLKDKYGRVMFHRVRIKVDVSAKQYVEFRRPEEIGRCECDDKVMWIVTACQPYGDNPDEFYCGECLKLVNRQRLDDRSNVKK